MNASINCLIDRLVILIVLIVAAIEAESDNFEAFAVEINAEFFVLECFEIDVDANI